jgi:hypothetical protein
MTVRRPVTVVFEGAVAESPLVEQQTAACGLRHNEAGQPVDSAGKEALGPLPKFAWRSRASRPTW